MSGYLTSYSSSNNTYNNGSNGNTTTHTRGNTIRQPQQSSTTSSTSSSVATTSSSATNSAVRKLSYEVVTPSATTASVTTKSSHKSSQKSVSSSSGKTYLDIGNLKTTTTTSSASTVKVNQQHSNAHLLDHGYGATMDTWTGKFTTPSSKSSEPHITDYYKQVKRRLPNADNSSASSPHPSKQAKNSSSHQTPYIHSTSSTSSTVSHHQQQQQQSHHHHIHHTQQHHHHQQQQQQHHRRSTTSAVTTTTTTHNTTTSSSSASRNSLAASEAAAVAAAAAASGKKRSTDGRGDTSLGILTKRFVDLLRESPNGVVDLNDASQKLSVLKRRIYDITNVLEGIGILEKKSKNNIQWKCGNSLVSAETSEDMQLESDRLEQKENHLNHLICLIRDQLDQEMKQNTEHAYVTHSDLKNVDLFKEQIVIVVKAPPEAKLVLPDAGNPREIHIKAENNGEINVLLCHDNSPKTSPTISNDPLFDNINRLTPVTERKPGLGLYSAYPVRSAQRDLSKSIEEIARFSNSKYLGCGEFNTLPTTTKPVLTNVVAYTQDLQQHQQQQQHGDNKSYAHQQQQQQYNDFFMKQQHHLQSGCGDDLIAGNRLTGIPVVDDCIKKEDCIGGDNVILGTHNNRNGSGVVLGQNDGVGVAGGNCTLANVSSSSCTDSSDLNNTLSSCNNKSGLKHDVAMVDCSISDGDGVGGGGGGGGGGVCGNTGTHSTLDGSRNDVIGGVGDGSNRCNLSIEDNEMQLQHYLRQQDQQNKLIAPFLDTCKKGGRDALNCDSVNLSPNGSLFNSVGQSCFDEFVLIEPLRDVDFRYVLGDEEGLNDLFDLDVPYKDK